MLKLIFFCLLIANALLYALGQGYFANPVFEPRQPQRLMQQQNAGQLKLVSAEVATAPVVAAVAASAAASAAAAKPEIVACLEWGAFTIPDLAKVEDRLKTLSFGNRQARLNVQDTATSMVFIPPQGSKEAADKKALELNHLGIHDFTIVTDQGPLRWGILMGLFKTEELAKQHLASLVSKGVHSAKVGVHTAETNKFNYTFKNVNDTERAGLEKLKADFPNQDLHRCNA